MYWWMLVDAPGESRSIAKRERVRDLHFANEEVKRIPREFTKARKRDSLRWISLRVRVHGSRENRVDLSRLYMYI